MNTKRSATLKRAASKHLPRTRSATALTQKKREAALVKARAAKRALSPVKESSNSKSMSKSKSKSMSKSKKSQSKKSQSSKGGFFASFF
jgi:hypothetical protein